MSTIDTNVQVDSKSEVEAPPKLTFLQRFLWINLWSASAIIAIAIIKESSYWSSDFVLMWVSGWVLLCGTFILSLALWRFLKRGRIRALIAMTFFLMFNLLFLSVFVVRVTDVVLEKLGHLEEPDFDPHNCNMIIK